MKDLLEVLTLETYAKISASPIKYCERSLELPFKEVTQLNGVLPKTLPHFLCFFMDSTSMQINLDYPGLYEVVKSNI